DPRVHHVFIDWIDPLMDRHAALSVTGADTVPGAAGRCFSVESTSVALAPPVDPGTYCYRADGILTAAVLDVGTLTLTSTADAPPSVTMPGSIVTRPPLPLTAPAAPKPTVTPSAASTPTSAAG